MNRYAGMTNGVSAVAFMPDLVLRSGKRAKVMIGLGYCQNWKRFGSASL
jgi:hypothetical protein